MIEAVGNYGEIFERDLGAQQLVRALLAVSALKRRQLQPIVDPQHFAAGAGQERCDAHAILDCQGDDVSEIVLALRVGILELLEPALERPGREHHDAGVAFAQLALADAGIAFLDNAQHLTVAAAHDATITGRWCEISGQQADALGAGRREQRLEGCRADQWHIAVENEHAVRIRQMRRGLLHRMSGTELLGLVNPADVGTGTGSAHGLAAMPIDDVHGCGAQCRCRIEDMLQQGAASQRLQDFGQVGIHPLALARRQDQDCERRGRGSFGGHVSANPITSPAPSAANTVSGTRGLVCFSRGACADARSASAALPRARARRAPRPV